MKIIFANSAISAPYLNALRLNRVCNYLQSYYYERQRPSGERVVRELTEGQDAKSQARS